MPYVRWWWPTIGFSYLVVTVCSHVSEERTACQFGSGGCWSNLEGGMCRLCGKVWGDFGHLRKGKRVYGLYWATWFRVFQEPCFSRSAAVVSLKMEGVRSSETPVQTSATRREPKKLLHEQYPPWQHQNVCTMSLMFYRRPTLLHVSALEWFGNYFSSRRELRIPSAIFFCPWKQRT